jgi:CRP-like cAMP-binding protein
MDATSRLDQVQLLAGLGDAARRALAAVARFRAYEGGQIIMLEGDEDAPVFFVLAGAVRVFRTNVDGREQTIIHLGPGDAFNVPSAFADARRAPASAVALGPAELLCVSRQDFYRIVTETPEFALALLRDFANKLYHLTDLTYDLSLRTVRARLARFLLEQVEAENTAPVRWTHEEIATRIGTVREVVSRTLRSFVQDGLIQIERHRIVVLDRSALELEAQA